METAQLPVRPAVEVHQLTKRFQWRDRWFRLREVTALNQLSFQVAPGKACGILGPNGSGKSTLLRILSTVLLPTSGTAWVAGFPISRANPIKRQLGVVPCQVTGFSHRLSGRENLKFFAALHSLPPHSIQRRLDQLLELLGLDPLGEKPFWTYSTGERQRLNLARGLIHDPSLCLFDEPTRSLDPWTAGSLRQWIRSELVGKQGKTILIASNQKEDITDVCDHALLLRQGQRVWQGPAEEVKNL